MLAAKAVWIIPDAVTAIHFFLLILLDNMSLELNTLGNGYESLPPAKDGGRIRSLNCSLLLY